MPKRELFTEEVEQLTNQFTYHVPSGDQAARYDEINQAALAFAKTVLECTPKCADQSAALRQIREARMTANAAIACNE